MNGHPQNLTKVEKCGKIPIKYEKPEDGTHKLARILIRIFKFAVTLLEKEYPPS